MQYPHSFSPKERVEVYETQKLEGGPVWYINIQTSTRYLRLKKVTYSL
jgi:hypothetical protein